MNNNSEEKSILKPGENNHLNRRGFINTSAILGAGLLSGINSLGNSVQAYDSARNRKTESNLVLQQQLNNHTMIQFFALIPRKKGVSSQEFHDHWRHPHGTMGRNISTLTSYVQSHHIHTNLLGADQARFEGIAESTFDTVADAMSFGEEPYYKKHIQPDEPNFVDGPGLEWLNTKEEVLVPRAVANGNNYADSLWVHLDLPVSIKLLQFIRSDGNPDWAGTDDVELGQRIAALRHVRNYPMKEIHGDKPPYIGVRQLWWPTLTAFNAGVQKDPEAFNKLISRAGNAVTLLAQAERLLR